MAASFVIDNLPGKIRICATDATGRYQVAEIPRVGGRPSAPADDEAFCRAIDALDAVMYRFAVPATSVYPSPEDYLLPGSPSRPSGPGDTSGRIPD